ncbi:hypothetical protein EGW08_005088 [Elysia chlorotica]|uniref:Uncharacterized protein n=1 Tax=Elysia chlorotica TaxID=188477 RepID=A0A433U009_ELYCH|nr:hypothetical protein EGW08_005088 [Elysia chlorotica]
MSSSNPVGENPDRSCLVPIPHSLRDPKSTVSEKIEGSSLGIPSRKLTVATTSLRPDSFDNRRPLSPLLSRSPVSTPNGNPESRKNWSTDTSRQGDRPSAVSATGTDVTSGGCVSPPENLHANKWAQIIIRARQRQVQGETTGSGFPTCPTEPACVDLKQELPSAAVLASDFKMPPSRLVEMWFSKKRPRKTESGIPGDGGAGSSTGPNGSADRNAVQETTQHKNSSIIKSSGGKDKKPALSMGKVLAKKDEKETGEDLEFKRQCKLELEMRLSECGFGIHAPAKERQTKERKAREAKRHRNTVLDAASQTDLQFEAQGLDLTSNTTTNVIDGSIPSGMNGANVASGSGIGSNGDRPSNSNYTEKVLDNQSSALKARSLPENFHTQVGKTSPSYADSAGRFSLVSLKPEQTEAEFHPPARRTRSLLDSFRDVACKALWRRPQRTSKANVPSLASSSDLTTNSNASNAGGAEGECSNFNSNGVDSKSSPKKGAEESKASVLNQDKVVHGNVLRSVVFYQNRFIVMHHSKSNTKKTNSPEKTQNLEKISTENVSPCAGKDVNPENGSSVSEGNNSTENPCSSKDQSFGNKCDNEAPSCKNRLQSSQSYSGVGTAGQPLLSLAGAVDTRSCLVVDVSPTHCLKSESDMELELYYNRVQDLNLEHGRLRSPIGARSEYQSGHVDDVDFAKDRKVSSHKDCAQKSDGIESHQSNTDKSPQEQKEDSCEASACVSVGPKGNPRSPSYDGNLGKTNQPPVKGKERRSKSSSSYHDKEDGFIELEGSGRTSSSRSRSRKNPQGQNENTKQGHNSRHRERYIPRTDKRVSDYKLAESGISNEFFNEIIPARDKQQTLPSENTILKQDHEIVENSRRHGRSTKNKQDYEIAENSRRHGRSTKRSCTKSLDRNALPEGAMESKHKDWREAGEAVEADVVKAGCSSDALRHHKQVHQSGKKSDHILNEETNDHQKYRDCSHGNQEQHYPGSSHGNIDRHSFSDYFHPNQDRRTKRETTRPRKDRAKSPLFVDDAKNPEDFCEITHVSRRDNKNVQFQDDELYISEASPRGVSPRQKYSHQRQEFKLRNILTNAKNVNLRNKPTTTIRSRITRGLGIKGQLHPNTQQTSRKVWKL